MTTPESSSIFSRFRHPFGGKANHHEIVGSTPEAPSQSFKAIAIPSDGVFLLSFDGGGIRGFVTLLVLQALMAEVGRIERDSYQPIYHSFHPDEDPASKGSSLDDIPESQRYRFLPCHYFDYVAGTSTGGLIAIMLGRLRMSVDDCIKEYETFGKEIFGHPRSLLVRPWISKYRSSSLKKAVEGVASRHNPSINTQHGITLKSPEDLCRTMVFSIQEEDYQPYIFRSYDYFASGKHAITELNPGEAHTDLIQDVALATTAAPTYFKPKLIAGRKFVDGGVIANNPTLYAYEDITKHKAKAGLLVSIGTGKSGPRIRNIIELLDKLSWLGKILTNSEETHRRMQDQQERSQGTDNAFHYTRLNVEHGMEGMKMDQWKSKGRTLQTMRNAAARYLDDEKVKEQIHFTAEKLVERRQRRSRLPNWTRFATGFSILCSECSHQQRYFTMEELEAHHNSSHPQKELNYRILRY